MESLQRLKSIIDTLRSPGGCPWDLEQTPESLRPFLLEEAHEVAQAIEEGDSEHICEELGDLLMNIFLQARIGEEENTFSLNDVAENISDKLIRRHPHVFGDADAADPEAVRRQWEEIKQPLPASLPALCRADRVGQMVAKVGFDWPDSTGAMEKVKEELDELHEAVAKGVPEEIEHEIGDILFAVSSVARKVGVDPEVALSRSLSRFEERFKVVDQKLGERESAPLDQLEEWYLEGKEIQNRNQE